MVDEDKAPKAFLQIVKTAGAGEKIPCMYNPETVKISRSNKWEQLPMPGKGIKTAVFKGSEQGSFEIETLWFDTTDTGDPVTKYTDKLMALLDLDKKVQGTSENTNNARPPVVRFHWGHMVSFPCYVSSVDVEFTYFSSTGVPLRAKVDLELEQFSEDELAKQNPTSGTPFPHQVHRMLPGETLDRISAHYYGDSNRWRALAAANGIEDPLAVRPGALLMIPEITSL
jgi:Contractile injection system tube protein/LysM domain